MELIDTKLRVVEILKSGEIEIFFKNTQSYCNPQNEMDVRTENEEMIKF